MKINSKVKQVRDGIVISEPGFTPGYNELVEIKTESGTMYGLVLNVSEEECGIISLGDYKRIKSGNTLLETGNKLSIEISDEILGHIINPLGLNFETGEKIVNNGTVVLLDTVAPGINYRKNVSRPLETGVLGIDALIPIGKGQRELIIGDRQTGKTSLALSSIINQKGKGVVCVYVSIGQKNSKLAEIISILERKGAMDYTIVVAANASDPASYQFVSPFTGTAIAEFFAKKGKDALIIYDDLTKHAWAYREISLLLKRPAGREAYPGDIFYLHSRLLERALQYNDSEGGGSITAIPIIETQQGDISGYIQTNVISITDGQIFLDTDLFNSNQKPAINFGASVSRVGSAAQYKVVKQFSGKLKLELAHFRELESFAQFGSELDEETLKKLHKGKVLNEILKQPERRNYTVEEETLLLIMVTKGIVDNIEINRINDISKEVMKSCNLSKEIIKNKYLISKELTSEDIEKIINDLKNVIENFLV